MFVDVCVCAGKGGGELGESLSVPLNPSLSPCARFSMRWFCVVVVGGCSFVPESVSMVASVVLAVVYVIGGGWG